VKNNFKQYLLEGNEGYFAPWHLRTSEQIQRWLDDGISKIKGFKINKDGSITLVTDIFDAKDIIEFATDNGERKKVLRLKFKRSKNFQIISPTLTSLWGVPDICSGNLSITCSKLLSLEHLTPKVEGTLWISCSELKEINCGKVSCEILQLNSIGDMNLCREWKQFSNFSISKKIYLGNSVVAKMNKTGILNLCKLLKATGAEKIIFLNSVIDASPELARAIDIINVHKDNIIACQKEMFDNDLDEYAEL
jgi:hypothetical protein